MGDGWNRCEMATGLMSRSRDLLFDVPRAGALGAAVVRRGADALGRECAMVRGGLWRVSLVSHLVSRLVLKLALNAAAARFGERECLSCGAWCGRCS